MYGQSGETNAPASSQSMYNNEGIANVTGIGASSPTRNASSTKHSPIVSCIVRSCSIRQCEPTNRVSLLKIVFLNTF